MSDLRVFIANCLAGMEANGRIEFKLAGKACRLEEKLQITGNNLRELQGGLHHTCDLVVLDVAPDEVKSVLKAAEQFCWFMAFAGMSHVLLLGHNYPDGKFGGAQRSVSGVTRYFRPTIAIRHGPSVKKFIEQAFEGYRKVERKRQLNVAVNYLLLADEEHQPVECRLLMAVVLLENLKTTYAKSRGYTRSRGGYKTPTGAPIGFEKLLTEMFAAVGMNNGLKRVVQARNEVVHSGVLARPYSSQTKMYERIHDLAREYLLRLIGYRGTFNRYSHSGRATAKL